MLRRRNLQTVRDIVLGKLYNTTWHCWSEFTTELVADFEN
jgi:hypothetical protein